MTGAADVETVHHAVQAGADRVLAKPVDLTQLIQILAGEEVASP